MQKFEWKVSSQVVDDERVWQVWRQTRELYPHEPIHSEVREYDGWFEDRETAQRYADQLNREEN